MGNKPIFIQYNFNDLFYLASPKLFPEKIRNVYLGLREAILKEPVLLIPIFDEQTRKAMFASFNHDPRPLSEPIKSNPYITYNLIHTFELYRAGNGDIVTELVGNLDASSGRINNLERMSITMIDVSKKTKETIDKIINKQFPPVKQMWTDPNLGSIIRYAQYPGEIIIAADRH